MKNQQIGVSLIEVLVALLLLTHVLFALLAMQIFAVKEMRKNNDNLMMVMQQSNAHERKLASMRKNTNE